MKNLVSLILVGTFLLLSCSTQKIIHESPSGDRLFPMGKYEHKISLQIPAHDGVSAKHFSFRGVVQIQPEMIRVVVLSFLGTTAFKMSENLKTGEIKTEVYIEQMKRFEPRLKEYYLIMREVLLATKQPTQSVGRLKWIRTNEAGFPIEMETLGLEKNATFKIISFDKNNIPTEFLIEHPHFDVDVKVVNYEI